MFLMAFALVAADDLSGSISSQSGNPGSTVTYTLTYTNAGATAITVSSTSTSLSDGTNTITAPTISSVSVPAASSATVSFTITVPSTPAGTYTGTITGTDTSNSANTETLSYSLTVNSVDSMTLSASSLSLELQGGSAETNTFTITNAGSTTLSSFSISFTSSDGDTGVIKDNDDDETAVTFTGASSSLSPGSSTTVTVHADPDDSMDLGTYSGTINITATGSSSTTGSLSLSTTISPDICEEGKQGSDFNIDIRNPDSSDDFVPGDTVPMEIKVENNANDDLDVELEITLYNLDSGNKEAVERVSGSVNEDESETFTVDFEIPQDLDDKDDYRFYVQVHEDGNEDDSCDYESVNIDLSRKDEDAIISEASLSPAVGLTCGDDYRVSLYIDSTGGDGINDLYVEVQDGDLGVQESSENFDLGDFNDDDNQEKLSFDLTIPTDITEGDYSLEAILYDTNGKTLDSELITVTVDSCTAQDIAGDIRLDISEDYTVDGDQLTLGMVITNTGEKTSTLTVTASDVDWATFSGSEYLESLQAGDEEHAYLYLTLDASTTGKHDLEVTVTDDLGNSVTKTVTVDFGEASAVEEDSFFSGINSWFANNAQGSFWIIVDIILVILALVFVRMLFNKK